MNGSFHLLSPLAAGEMLLPFSRSSLHTDSGNCGGVQSVELLVDELAADELAGKEGKLEQWAGSSSPVLSLTLV